MSLPRRRSFHLWRWLALLLLPALVPWTTFAAELRDTADPVLQRGLEQAVHDLSLDEAVRQRQLAVAVVDLARIDAPRLAMLNGDHMMYAASLPKIGILVAALAEAERGAFALSDERLRAMHEMIRRSSNVDATRVLQWVGEDRVLQVLQSERFRFYDPATGGGLWVGKAYGRAPAFRRDPLHQLSHGATAYQVARLYTLLAQDRLFGPKYNALMREILGDPGIDHKFVRALKDLPDVRLYRKSGTWRDHHADSALVEQGGRRYVIVALAQHPDGGTWLVELGRRLHALVAEQSPTSARARR